MLASPAVPTQTQPPALLQTLPTTQPQWQQFINQLTSSQQLLSSLSNANTTTQAGIGAILFPTTPAETAANITPANPQYFGQPWLWVRREGCVLDGVTDDSADFNVCLTIASTTNTALLIDGPCYLNSNITIPQNVQLVFVGAGTLKPGSGKIVTLGQSPQAGLWQIFDYTAGGKVVMPPLFRACEVWAEWWGANGDGVTNIANDVAINAAMVSIWNAGAGSGGTVRLGAGEFFISAVIALQSYCTLKGLNNWTLIKAQPSWSGGASMVTAINGTASMFDSRLECIRFDANAIGSINQIVLGYSWQNRCGAFRCVFANFVAYAVYYAHGYGGAALLNFEECDFFPNDVNNAIGAYFTNDGIVGWLKLNFKSCAFASGGVNATVGCIVDNRIILDVQGVDIETVQVGIQLTGAATLTGCGLSGGGASGIAAMIHCGSTWTAPGFIDVSGAQIGAATAMLTDANRSYAYLALEPMDGRVVHPSTMSKPVGTVLVTGGSSPTAGHALGVCSTTVTHEATGQNRLTLGTSMDSSADIIGFANSLSASESQAQVVPVDATHVDVYTYTPAGVAADSSAFFVQLFHTP